MSAPAVDLGEGVTAEFRDCAHGERTHVTITVDGEQGERTITWCAECRADTCTKPAHPGDGRWTCT